MIAFLKTYWLEHKPGYTLCIAGNKETIAGDSVSGAAAHIDLSVGDFKHLYAGESDYDSIKWDSIRNAIDIVNVACGGVIGYDAQGRYLGSHTLALVKGDQVSYLNNLGYGNTYWPETRDSRGLPSYINTFQIQSSSNGFYFMYNEATSATDATTTTTTDSSGNVVSQYTTGATAGTAANLWSTKTPRDATFYQKLEAANGAVLSNGDLYAQMAPLPTGGQTSYTTSNPSGAAPGGCDAGCALYWIFTTDDTGTRRYLSVRNGYVRNSNVDHSGHPSKINYESFNTTTNMATSLGMLWNIDMSRTNMIQNSPDTADNNFVTLWSDSVKLNKNDNQNGTPASGLSAQLNALTVVYSTST